MLQCIQPWSARFKNHSHCTKWLRCKKCNKFVFSLCRNLKDAFEEEQDKIQDGEQEQGNIIEEK
eukprot:8718501-Ditylum_brightwellii.AAC.1